MLRQSMRSPVRLLLAPSEAVLGVERQYATTLNSVPGLASVFKAWAVPDAAQTCLG